MKRSDFIQKSMSVLGMAVIPSYLFGKNNSADQSVFTVINKNQTMNTPKTAKELLLGYLENINNPDKAIELFAEDAIIELPYMASLGRTWQWQGKEAVHSFLKNIPKSFPGFEFQNIQVYIDTPDQAFGEYDVHCTVAATGRPYNQNFMGRLVAENGKIKLLREALDMVQVAKSIFPNGVIDLPGKKSE